MKYDDITEVIGDTPLLKIDEEVHGVRNLQLYVKMESMNPFGSLKDRVAWSLLEDDIEMIREEDRKVVESSSGNTAKAIQGITSSRGIDFRTITNRIKIDEVKDLLITMGTEIEELPGKSECPDPNDPDDPLTYIDNLMEEEGDSYYRTGQYTDEKNTEAHRENTGPEIMEDLDRIDYFFGGLGTTGSTKGITQAIRERNPELNTVGIVSSSDDFIPGIRTENEMWEVGLYEKELYSDVLTVNSGEAIDATLDLIRGSGILSGPTTGAQLAAIRDYFPEELEEEKTAVFLACDRLEPYMSYFKKRRPELFGGEKQEIETTGEPDQITVDKAHQEFEDFTVVDIRSNPAYKASHIPGSINITGDRLKDILRTGNPFPNRKILVVCPTGDESGKYAAMIDEKGGEAYNLDKGITEWRDSGKPLENTF
jgi:cysteine synthase B